MSRYKLTSLCIIVLILLITGVIYACVDYRPIPYITNAYTQYAVKDQSLAFDGNSSTDMDSMGGLPGISAYWWRWNLGESYNILANSKPSHSYSSAGYKYVTLKVTDNDDYLLCYDADAAFCEVYVSEVNNVAYWWWGEDNAYHWDTGPVYIPVGGENYLYATSNPNYGPPEYYMLFPANFPTWSVTPYGPTLTLQSYSGGDQTDGVKVSGLTTAGTYTVSAKAGDSDTGDSISVIAFSSIQKIPLGGSANLSKYIIGKIYVPTKYGGTLTFTGEADPDYIQLFYTDGSDLTNDNATLSLVSDNIVSPDTPGVYTIPEDQYGWYYVTITETTSTGITNEFIQTGQASTRPWNGWYWPTLGTENPNLYDSGGPLDKYDQVYGLSSQNWESMNHSGGVASDGHCRGFAIASIALSQPSGLTHGATTFLQDDMEGLYIELADNNLHSSYSAKSIYGIPASPSPSSGEPIDALSKEFLDKLRINLREDQTAIYTNLRGVSNPNAIQNHAIWYYSSTMVEVGGWELMMQITTTIYANDYTSSPPTTGTTDRTETFVFQMKYTDGGEIENYSGNNWISASHYAPETLMRMSNISWSASNTAITKLHVDGL
jgi:hypothetical protein